MKFYQVFLVTLFGVFASGYADHESVAMKRVVRRLQRAARKTEERRLFDIGDILGGGSSDVCSMITGVIDGGKGGDTDGYADPSGMECSCSGSLTEINFDCMSTKAYCEEYSNGKKVCFTADGQSTKMTIPLLTGDSNINTCTKFGDETTDASIRGTEVCGTFGMDTSSLLGLAQSEPNSENPNDGFSLFTSCAVELNGSDCTCNFCENEEGVNIVCPGSETITCDDFQQDFTDNTDDTGMNVLDELKSIGPGIFSKFGVQDPKAYKLTDATKNVPVNAPTDATKNVPINVPTDVPQNASTKASDSYSPLVLNIFVFCGSIMSTMFHLF